MSIDMRRSSGGKQRFILLKVLRDCKNGQYRLIKWREELCEVHGTRREEANCNCTEPFSLQPFPGRKKNPKKRKIWKLLINIEKDKKLWSPGSKSRICSNHFVSSCFDYPTLDLGYDSTKRISNLVPQDSPCYVTDCKRKPACKRKLVENVSICDGIPESLHVDEIELTHDKAATISVNTTQAEEIINLKQDIILLKQSIEVLNVQNTKTVQELVMKYEKEKLNLNQENKLLYKSNKIMRKKLYVFQNKKSVCEELLNSNKNVLFYTGMQNTNLFNSIHVLVAPLIRRNWYGSASKKITKKFKKMPNRLGAKTKLCSKDEMLLTLMKLRLGLMETDLAHRFKVSLSLVNRIFLTWIKGLSSVIKHLIFISIKGSLNFTRTKSFDHLKDIQAIIDATEVFIETPTDLELQKITWSEYKHHNTVKILVAVTPNSFISFISKSYPGSISDKKLVNDSKFLDNVPQYSYIMADKGFNIANECIARNITLYVPPGKRGSYQMLPNEVTKTKKIANLRILVEQFIRQMKTFKILSNEFPIKLLNWFDDIVTICSGLCNLLPPIFGD